jgi:hypothetical protein
VIDYERALRRTLRQVRAMDERIEAENDPDFQERMLFERDQYLGERMCEMLDEFNSTEVDDDYPLDDRFGEAEPDDGFGDDEEDVDWGLVNREHLARQLATTYKSAGVDISGHLDPWLRVADKAIEVVFGD